MQMIVLPLQVLHEAQSILKDGHKGIMLQKHVLQGPQDSRIQVWVPTLPDLLCQSSIPDVELGIFRALVWRRQKSATPMVHGTMEFEHRGTTTATHESMINISAQICERQCHIVLSNVTTKFHGLRLITLQEAPQRLGWGLKFGKLNLPRQTAFPKFGIGHRRITTAFSHPMQSPTVRAFDVHRPKIMRHICVKSKCTALLNRKHGRFGRIRVLASAHALRLTTYYHVPEYFG